MRVNKFFSSCLGKKPMVEGESSRRRAGANGSGPSSPVSSRSSQTEEYSSSDSERDPDVKKLGLKAYTKKKLKMSAEEKKAEKELKKQLKMQADAERKEKKKA